MFTKLWNRAGSNTPRATADRVRPKSAGRLRLEPLEDRCLLSGNVVLHWNEVLLQTLTSHTGRVPLARNLALVHVAMFDAVNAIDRSYEPYAADVHASRGASKEAAAAQAAHDTLVALYPARQAIFDTALVEDLAGIPPGRARQGIAIGQEVARQILTLRSADGSSAIVGYTPPNNDPGQWHPTPPDFSPAAAAHVPAITPFAVTGSTQFRPAPPPTLASAEYAAALNEAKTLGRATGSTRTPDQTQVAGIWRVPLTIHQVWNRIAQDVAEERDTSLVESARLFALLNMAFNDGLQTSFESKFHYGLWRPVEAIRRAAEDGNPATDADPTWTTLHPATPPYPTYAGNAATFGAAGATVLAGVFGGDAVPFQIAWDRYGFAGVTRSYAGFWAAADESARSRVYGGIHFTFDSAAGQGIGVNVGEYVVDNFLQPRRHGHGGSQGAAASGPGPPAAPGPIALPPSAGLDPFSHYVMDVRIVDLGATLGPASGDTIRPDDKAAGRGRFVDQTPREDSERHRLGEQAERGRMDLLTVLEHEADGRMPETLTDWWTALDVATVV